MRHCVHFVLNICACINLFSAQYGVQTLVTSSIYYDKRGWVIACTREKRSWSLNHEKSFTIISSVIFGNNSRIFFLNKDTCNLKTFVIVHTALASWGVKHWFTHLYSFVFKVRLLLLWRVWLKNVDVVNHSFHKTVQIPMTFTISSKQSFFFLFFKMILSNRNLRNL